MSSSKEAEEPRGKSINYVRNNVQKIRARVIHNLESWKILESKIFSSFLDVSD